MQTGDTTQGAQPEVPAGDIMIPAHNEAAVIGRCLEALRPSALGPSVRVIVACNGCTDETADISRRYGVEVLEIDPASKTAAIRAAESLCRAASRIYLDADVELHTESARAMLEHLADGCVAARPQIRYLTDGCSWSVRRYHRARQGIPSVMNRLWGAGVYGLAPEGRARFGDYPDVTAEDYWVDLHFSDADICILEDCPPVDVRVPRSAPDLLRVLGRVYRGPVEVRPPSVEATAAATRRELLSYARRGPRNVFDAVVYAAYASGSRLSRERTGSAWVRDDSSRGAR